VKTVINILCIISIRFVGYFKHIYKYKDNFDVLIIVKLDAIGDYVISSNLIPVIVNNEKFISSKKVLVGNVLWKDLAVKIHSGFIDEYIFIDVSKYENNTFNQLKFISKLAKFNCKALINLHVSRNALSDIICTSLKANQSFAIKGSAENSSAILHWFANKLYTKLFTEITAQHEFDKLKEFIKYIVNENLLIDKPTINLDTSYIGYEFSNLKYIVVAHGAGKSERMLEDYKMKLLISYILDKYNVYIIFIGSSKDSLFVESFVDNNYKYSKRIIDMTGKSTLDMSALIIKCALAVICYDSGIYHLSLALDKKTFCIAGGGHFNRFVLYRNTTSSKIIYNPMTCYNCSWQCNQEYIPKNAYPCIKSLEYDFLATQFDVFFNGMV